MNTKSNKEIMKTTKRTSLNKRIEKLNLSKNSLVYKWVLDLNTNDVLRPVFSQGNSWKHSLLIDKTLELVAVLRNLKIDFEIGNDAPRNGKAGFFVKINTKIIE